MLIQRLQNGTVLVEVRADVFREHWRTARQDEKVVLDDRRPAVRITKPTGDTCLYTLHPLAWDILKKEFKTLMEAGHITTTHEKRCAFCASPLTVHREMEGLWVMVCKNCSSMATISKTLEGGTIGQGEKDQV